MAIIISPAASSAIANSSKKRTAGWPAPNTIRPTRYENAMSVAVGMAQPRATAS